MDEFLAKFRDVVQSYSQCLKERKRLTGILRDTFPNEALKVNLLLNAYDIAVNDIASKQGEIASAVSIQWRNKLISHYGITEENAEWTISSWCFALGKRVDAKVQPTKDGGSTARTGGKESGNSPDINERKATAIVDWLVSNIDEVEEGDFDEEDIIGFIDRNAPKRSAEIILDFVERHCNFSMFLYLARHLSDNANKIHSRDEVVDELAKIIRKKHF